MKTRQNILSVLLAACLLASMPGTTQALQYYDINGKPIPSPYSATPSENTTDAAADAETLRLYQQQQQNPWGSSGTSALGGSGQPSTADVINNLPSAAEVQRITGQGGGAQTNQPQNPSSNPNSSLSSTPQNPTSDPNAILPSPQNPTSDPTSSLGGSGSTGIGSSLSGISVPKVGLSEMPILQILATLLRWLISVFLLLSVISFVITGIQFVIAMGSSYSDAAQAAKKNFNYSIIAVVVVGASYIIITTISSLLSGNAG